MKFNVSSSVLTAALQNAIKVISSKPTIPILDYFLFEIEGDKLTITSSDAEIIYRTVVNVVNEDGEELRMALPSKRTLDSLRELYEQPLTFDVDTDSWEVVVIWSSGNMKISAMPATGYPEINTFEQFSEISLPVELLDTGLKNTIFAAEQSSNLRPVMQGVLIDIEQGHITFVATNAQHLAKFEVEINDEVSSNASLIIPAKTVSVLRAICAKESETAKIQFDQKNILFKFGDAILMSRLVEGNYPRYKQVIPQNNPRTAVVNRQAFLSAVKRVSVCSNPANGLVMLEFKADKVFMTCADAGFGLYAEDTLNIQYNDEPMTIGFKSQYLMEMLSVIESDEVDIKLADAARPGLFVPSEQPSGEEFLVVLMPITMN